MKVEREAESVRRQARVLLGPTGALLSMPITVTIMLIAEQDKRTRWLARFMGSGEE